jgi:hypothetical protein
MNTMKAQPYAQLDVTPDPIFNVGTSSCDCKTLDFATLPSTPTVVGGTIYFLASCVNYVHLAGSWLPQCGVSGDPGYKSIVVQVSWRTAGERRSATQEAMLSRY